MPMPLSTSISSRITQRGPAAADEHATPFNNQIRGVNLGGWMVLEPWITPSLFYQFLSQPEGQVAIDTYSFCEVLGAEEANLQLRRHWDTWVTEDIIRQLAESGAVNSLRLPVGDFMYEPYGPYVGCTDGATDYVEDLLDWAHEYGLTVLIDIHAMKGSQNGFDNSGKTLGFEWTSTLTVYPRNLVTFQHWPIRTAEWMGTFDRHAANYSSINHDNINHSLRVISKIVDAYSGHPAVLGLQPVNEPWEQTPIEHLKSFYWEGYLIVKKHAPYWKYIMHDSFRFDPNIWGGFMAGCPDRALDTHIYQAWLDPGSRVSFFANACQQKKNIAAMEQAFGPIVVGEWSLATDNCAMWLNGFNDNLPGFPRLPCKYVPCAQSYMNDDEYQQPGTPVDPSKPIQGPYGTGMSGPVWGLCPVGRDWVREMDPEHGQDFVHTPAEAPQRRDDTDAVISALALKKINAFSGIGHGFYFWNFRTDLDEPHWSYMAALEKGWIPSGNLNSDSVNLACHKEDNGLYQCVSKRDQLENVVRNNVKGCILAQDSNANVTYVDSLRGDDLFDEADQVFDAFWQEHRVEGATCDFGGIATLKEINMTYADDDDYYNFYEGPSNEHPVLHLCIVLLGGLAIGGLLGFFIAMRVNRSFNESVVRNMEQSNLLRPISHSRVFRNSFASMDLNYEAIPTASGKKKSGMKPNKSAYV
eukprot:CAMPEP_0178485420 /NCGR_PEP_ID=MMETSP0696-20121128/8264_1 /TAXON_ID=265572 /ORGANISM="Extubocellulus spinifer, Strain CCMP396" /LENGTH=695 /DNA_ID=CAMNT_0020113015 /DNA_START=195 /DNA_END=2281 /DNA_ORIENTATION=+